MINFFWPYLAAAMPGIVALQHAAQEIPKEHEMDKRRARYEQAERTTSAESKVKALRQEVHDLRKQLFRAEESARLANEEATARAQAQRQSGEALRAQLAVERADAARWEKHAEAAWAWNREIRDMALWRIAVDRIRARFGRAT